MADGITREHIVTMQDIRNVQNQFNIQGNSRNANDLTSIMAWVEEWKTSEHNPILLFKPQGEQQGANMDDIGVNDFLLLLQTQFQLDMLKVNEHKCICMDTTYGVICMTSPSGRMGQGYCSCLVCVPVRLSAGPSVCLSVCLSVCVHSGHKRYPRVSLRLLLDFDTLIFEKP